MDSVTLPYPDLSFVDEVMLVIGKICFCLECELSIEEVVDPTDCQSDYSKRRKRVSQTQGRIEGELKSILTLAGEHCTASFRVREEISLIS